MSMNNVGRPTRPEAANDAVVGHETLTGARGLLQALHVPRIVLADIRAALVGPFQDHGLAAKLRK